MKILQELCSVPTAPFVEGRIVQYAVEFVARRKKLRLERDPSGNLLILLPGRKPTFPRWIFGAHMDHPGMVCRRMVDPRTVEADFYGGVMAAFARREKVRFFDADREISGVITRAVADRETGRLQQVRARVPQPVSPGSIGMWDQGVGRIKGRRFLSRVCDDLAGAAAALSMIDQLHRRPPESTVGVLLTRAEEEGFVGAIAAASRPKLLRKSDRIVAIETSAAQNYAPLGLGPIIRLGDRTSIFNSALSYFLTQQAESLAAKDTAFRFQRTVMPGGTCEATVYDVFGFLASSICVALGNYHNMDKSRRRIAPEFIDIHDWQNMVRLFLAVARAGHTYQPGHRLLRQRLLKRFDGRKHLLSAHRVSARSLTRQTHC